MKTIVAGTAALALLAGTAQAATLGLDATSKALIGDFTASFAAIDPNFGNASGTTNGGVTWSTNILHYLPYSNGSGMGNIGTLNGSNTAPAFANDWMHAGSNFTLTFSESIAAILFSVSDNDSSPNEIIDFGVAPSLEGAGLSLSGTTVTLSNNTGGYMLFTGLSGTSFTSTAIDTDGSNYAFAVLTTADAVVPLPAGLPLALGGIGTLMVLRRRKA